MYSKIETPSPVGANTPRYTAPLSFERRSVFQRAAKTMLALMYIVPVTAGALSPGSVSSAAALDEFRYLTGLSTTVSSSLKVTSAAQAYGCTDSWCELSSVYLPHESFKALDAAGEAAGLNELILVQAQGQNCDLQILSQTAPQEQFAALVVFDEAAAQACDTDVVLSSSQASLFSKVVIPDTRCECGVQDSQAVSASYKALCATQSQACAQAIAPVPGSLFKYNTPVVHISHWDAQRLRDCLAGVSEETSVSGIVCDSNNTKLFVEYDTFVPARLEARSDALQVSLWRTPIFTSEHKDLFVNPDFGAFANAFAGTVEFLPEFFLIDGARHNCVQSPKACARVCINEGKYCLPSHGDLLLGKDMVTEAVKDMCIWEQLGSLQTMERVNVFQQYLKALYACAESQEPLNDCSSRISGQFPSINLAALSTCEARMISDGVLTVQLQKANSLVDPRLPLFTLNTVQTPSATSFSALAVSICTQGLSRESDNYPTSLCGCVTSNQGSEATMMATCFGVENGATSVPGYVIAIIVSSVVVAVLGIGMVVYRTRLGSRDPVNEAIYQEVSVLRDALTRHGLLNDPAAASMLKKKQQSASAEDDRAEGRTFLSRFLRNRSSPSDTATVGTMEAGVPNA